MKKNVNWPYMAGLFDSRGSVITCIMSSDPEEPVGRMTPVIQHEDNILMEHLIDTLGGVYFDTPDANGDEIYEWHPKGKKNRVRFMTGILPYTRVWGKDLKTALARESVETNTFRSELTPMKIESELTGDRKNAAEVTLAGK